MEDQGILQPSDLQMNAPSVTFTSTNFGGSSFSIRGIGNLVVGGESGVSQHINEIAVGTNLNSVEFYDMQRVEILRGPQGTLFGRNATGGAINFVTKKPDFDSVGGFLDVELGDYSNRRVKGAINVPIGDRFAIRAAGMMLERDGYITNRAFGQVGTDGSTISGIDDDIDGRDIQTMRVTARWDMTENMDLWVMYYNFDEDDDRARITNQVCAQTPIPSLGCEPNEFGFDTPNLPDDDRWPLRRHLRRSAIAHRATAEHAREACQHGFPRYAHRLRAGLERGRGYLFVRLQLDAVRLHRRSDRRLSGTELHPASGLRDGRRLLAALPDSR